MSRYLDIERFGRFVERHFGSESLCNERMVGADRKHDSWYFDIVRFFGQSAVDPSAVEVRRSAHSSPLRDVRIEAFARQIEMALRAQGRLYDGPPAMQIEAVDWSDGESSVTVRPIRYGDQAAGFAMDLVDPAFAQWGGTLRDYIRANYPSKKLEDSPLCAGVGVCGLLVVSEAECKYLLRVTRAGTLASLENTVGPSVAGSVEYADDYANLAEVIVRSLGREVEEELGLRRSEYRVRPLAYAREVVRGDRPQLFAMVETEFDRSQVSERLSGLAPEHREFSEFGFMPMHDEQISETEIGGLNFEAKMCYYLLEEWLDSRRRGM